MKYCTHCGIQKEADPNCQHEYELKASSVNDFQIHFCRKCWRVRDTVCTVHKWAETVPKEIMEATPKGGGRQIGNGGAK